MLSLYREAIRIRREQPGFASEAFRWVASDPSVLRFERGDGVSCLVNLSTAAVPLPASADIVLASGPLSDGALPIDAAVWLSSKGG